MQHSTNNIARFYQEPTRNDDVFNEVAFHSLRSYEEQKLLGRHLELSISQIVAFGIIKENATVQFWLTHTKNFVNVKDLRQSLKTKHAFEITLSTESGYTLKQYYLLIPIEYDFEGLVSFVEGSIIKFLALNS